jgi:hypothetical protein
MGAPAFALPDFGASRASGVAVIGEMLQKPVGKMADDPAATAP